MQIVACDHVAGRSVVWYSYLPGILSKSAVFNIRESWVLACPVRSRCQYDEHDFATNFAATEISVHVLHDVTMSTTVTNNSLVQALCVIWVSFRLVMDQTAHHD